ncbi:MAG: Uma2 family endonuclease [Actinobacteria bacterium]|nr:Uma2 family endonuclease [Actinomycetota bacterium]
MAVALQRRRLTVDEFHRMAASGVFDHDERLELWDGEIVEKSPIGGRHAHAVRRLNQVLSSLPVEHAIVDVQNPLRLDQYWEVYPDIVLLRPRHGGYRDVPTTDDAMLMIEVADTTVAIDRGPKARRYAAAGIDMYWVVDIPGRCLGTMTAAGSDRYGDVARHEDGMVMATGVPVDVAALL